MANCFENKRGGDSSKSGCFDMDLFDKVCDWNSDKPFEPLRNQAGIKDRGYPLGSRIKAYWSPNHIFYWPFRSLLTWKEYLQYQQATPSIRLKFSLATITNGQGSNYIANGGTILSNNPGNISIGQIARKYGCTNSKTKADGQQSAIFSNMTDGLAAIIELIVTKYADKNMCQINNGYQGRYTQDCDAFNDTWGFAALRLQWVTNICNIIGCGPDMVILTSDPNDEEQKENLLCIVYAICKMETGTSFSKTFLEGAYAKYIEKNKETTDEEDEETTD